MVNFPSSISAPNINDSSNDVSSWGRDQMHNSHLLDYKNGRKLLQFWFDEGTGASKHHSNHIATP